MRATATRLYPFVPSGPSFAEALKFFEELGFVKEWENGGFANLHFGQAEFLLQDINVPEWQANQMIVYEVSDLEGYWAEISAKNLPDRFAGVKQKPPTDFPWGREIHLVDPAGVCWHVRQSA